MAKKKSGGEAKAPEKSSSKGASKAASRGGRRPRRARARPPPRRGPKRRSSCGDPGELLKKIGGSEAGYLAAKKAEQRTIDALLDAS